MTENPDRMKTFMINGVPYRMRGDMPVGYMDALEQEKFEAEYQRGFDEGKSPADYDNGYSDGYEEGKSEGYEEGYKDAEDDADSAGLDMDTLT